MELRTVPGPNSGGKQGKMVLLTPDLITERQKGKEIMIWSHSSSSKVL